MRLTAPLPGYVSLLAHMLHGVGMNDAKGMLMTTYLDRVAWFAALLTILAWAMVPRPALAFPVMLPKVPAVETLPLPPFPLAGSEDRDG